MVAVRGGKAGGSSRIGWRFGVDVGFMRNVGSHSAVGATIAGGYTFLEYGGSEFISLRPRYRYWLSQTTSIDVGPGLQWTPGRIERSSGS